MKNSTGPGNLQMIVLNRWVVESINGLGSGYITYLVYQNSDIDPEVLEDVYRDHLGEGVLGEIIHAEPRGKSRIARVEVVKVNRYENFLRFDFRILEVKPFLRNGYHDPNSRYLCYYWKSPA